MKKATVPAAAQETHVKANLMGDTSKSKSFETSSFDLNWSNEMPEDPRVVYENEKPLFELLALLSAINILAQQRDLTLCEQAHIWRPFDV